MKRRKGNRSRVNLPLKNIDLNEFLVFKSENDNLKGFLTKGRKYEVGIGGEYCYLLNDQNQYRKYKMEYFMTMDEYRDKIIDDVIQ